MISAKFSDEWIKVVGEEAKLIIFTKSDILYGKSQIPYMKNPQPHIDNNEKEQIWLQLLAVLLLCEM